LRSDFPAGDASVAVGEGAGGAPGLAGASGGVDRMQSQKTGVRIRNAQVEYPTRLVIFL
jgi:hypothetical protein